ncbi:MAG: helix-turn-helix transcriptional regulator [Isosphaeraceae bacterium]
MGPAMSEKASDQQKQAIGLARTLPANRFPISRLLQLIVLLQAGRCPNARRLAEICEVSTRTVYRDLAILADAGITVNYRADRQGYEIARGLFLQPPRLEEREVLALLTLCRYWNQGDDLGLRCAAIQAVDKLIQSLPEPLRTRFLDAAEILGEHPAATSAAPKQASIHDEILAALVQRKQLRLWVREQSREESQATKIAIYRLTRVGTSWCLVGRSSWHCAVTLVPIDRIERVEPTADPYEIPPRFNLERFLAQNQSARNGPATADAV